MGPGSHGVAPDTKGDGMDKIGVCLDLILIGGCTAIASAYSHEPITVFMNGVSVGIFITWTLADIAGVKKTDIWRE